MTDLAHLISRSAAWHSSAVAVVDGDRHLTFGEVEQRSDRLASVLCEISPKSGTRVALLLGNRLEFVEADLAIVKAGKIKVPLNPRLSDLEREYVLSHSGADTLIFESGLEPFVAAALERLPGLQHLIRVGGGDRSIAGLEYEDVLMRASSAFAAVTVNVDDPSLILYTSGTTGRPKGAVATYRGRLAAIQNMLSDELDVRSGDGMIHVGPLSHGSGSKILAYYLRGARNILVRKFDPEAFFHIVEHERGTSSFMVPTMIAMLLDHRNVRYDLASLRTITYGGAPIAPRRLQEALDVFGPIFVQVYGSCEAPHPVTVLQKSEHQISRNDERRLASLGREVTAVEVRLVDGNGADVAMGDTGELLIRGSNVMKGYWRDPEATRAAFTGDFYRSGDAALRDDEGYLYMVDRVRDFVITGGLNVYPAEVEAALQAHAYVSEAAVIGVPDEVWGESVKAFVVLRPGTAVTAEELIEHCRTRLAGYKKPRSIEFVSGLPKGSTGKVLKRDLREPHWAGRGRGVN